MRSMVAGTDALAVLPEREALLAREAKLRSSTAWTEIYESNHGKIYRYLFARVGSQAAAEDLASTVFLDAIKSIDSYTYQGRPILAWLYRIARNVASDHLRREGRRGELERHSALVPEHTFDDAANERRDLADALNKITGDQRDALALRYFADLPTSVVARLMGKSEKAVFSLQARGLAALQRILSAGQQTS